MQKARLIFSNLGHLNRDKYDLSKLKYCVFLEYRIAWDYATVIHFLGFPDHGLVGLSGLAHFV